MPAHAGSHRRLTGRITTVPPSRYPKLPRPRRTRGGEDPSPGGWHPSLVGSGPTVLDRRPSHPGRARESGASSPRPMGQLGPPAMNRPVRGQKAPRQCAVPTDRRPDRRADEFVGRRTETERRSVDRPVGLSQFEGEHGGVDDLVGVDSDLVIDIATRAGLAKLVNTERNHRDTPGTAKEGE